MSGRDRPGWFERLLIGMRLMSPWCEPGTHEWLPIYGDQINHFDARWVCTRCPATHPTLTPHPAGRILPSPTALLVREWLERQEQERARLAREEFGDR